MGALNDESNYKLTKRTTKTEKLHKMKTIIIINFRMFAIN